MEKSELTPTRIITHQGIILNSLNNTFSLPPERLQRLKSQASLILTKTNHGQSIPTIQLQRFGSLAQSCKMAVGPWTNVHLRAIWDLLHNKQSKTAVFVPTSYQRHEILDKITTPLTTVYNTSTLVDNLHRRNTSNMGGVGDRQTLGTRAHISSSEQNRPSTGGEGHMGISATVIPRPEQYFSQRAGSTENWHRDISSVVPRERKSSPNLDRQPLRILCSNKRKVPITSHHGGTTTITLRSFKGKKIVLHPLWIASAANPADFFSRIGLDNGSDWKLHPRLFQWIQRELRANSKIDLFASELNKQLPLFAQTDLNQERDI